MKVPNQVYEHARLCNKQFKSFAQRGYTGCTFTGRFWKGRKELNSIPETEIGTNAAFSATLRTHVLSEEPDRYQLRFFGYKNGEKSLLLDKTFFLNKEPGATKEVVVYAQPVDKEKDFLHGLGEAEVMNLIDRKVEEREKAKELINLQTEVETLRREKQDLLLQKEELEATFEAQDKLKTYAEIAGKAAPLISAILGTHPIAATAVSLLSGLNGNAETAAAPQDENRTAILKLVLEFLNELNDSELADVYSVMARMQENKAIIQEVLHILKHRKNGQEKN